MEAGNKNQTTEGKIKFQAVGWKCLLQKRAGTSRILVLKSVVRGLCLERGMPIYSYCGFRSKVATHFGRKLPVVSEESCQ